MIRFLLVVAHGLDIEISDYQQEFRDFNVVVVRETDQFLRVVCEHNPQVIVSLGTVGQFSSLWSLPLWRRCRWLNIPDGNVAAETVRLAALSLLAGTCGGKLFADEPLVSCVSLDNNPHAIAQNLIQISENLDYDNLEYLIPEHLFTEVIGLLGHHVVTGSVCKIDWPTELVPLSIIRNVLAATRAQFLWPISSNSKVCREDLLESAVDVMQRTPGSSAIIGDQPSTNSVLGFLEGNGENPISHFIFRPDHVLRTVQFEHDFPLTSLSGLLLSLVADRSTIYIHDETSIGVTPNSWWSEDDRNHQMILQSSINFVKQIENT
jgi:hypothetical protein